MNRAIQRGSGPRSGSGLNCRSSIHRPEAVMTAPAMATTPSSTRAASSGGSDGAFGPRTRQMVASWQKGRNEPDTGFLTAAHQQALLRDAAPAVAKFDDDQKKQEEEAKKKAFTLNLEGVANRIECPLFVIAGGLDRLCPPEDAQRLAREAKGPTELLVIPDGNHVAHNRAYKYRPQSADWMAAQLRAKTR